jgi:hypothetical protein
VDSDGSDFFDRSELNQDSLAGSNEQVGEGLTAHD